MLSCGLVRISVMSVVGKRPSGPRERPARPGKSTLQQNAGKPARQYRRPRRLPIPGAAVDFDSEDFDPDRHLTWLEQAMICIPRSVSSGELSVEQCDIIARTMRDCYMGGSSHKILIPTAAHGPARVLRLVQPAKVTK